MKRISLASMGLFVTLHAFPQTLQTVTSNPNGNYTTQKLWLGMAPDAAVTEQTLNIGGKIKLLGAAQAFTTGIDGNQPTIYRSGVNTGSYPFNVYDNLILQAGIQNRDIVFVTGSTPAERMVIKSDGAVGIGTANPVARLDIDTRTDGYGLKIGDITKSNLRISGTSGAAGNGLIQTFHNGTTAGGNLVLQANGGKVGIGTAAPTCALHTVAYNNTDVAAALLWGEYFGPTIGVPNNSVSTYALHVVSNIGADGNSLTGGYKSLLYVGANGNTGIGTTNPGPYKLAVEGTLGARQIKVTQQMPWADFVFHDKYELPSIAQLEDFIKQHKHLPDIPSEAEVQENGVDVGEMNAKLLQKIEELTLYIIELNKKNEALERRMTEMERR